MRGPIIHAFPLVSGDAFVLMMPAVHESPNGILCEHWNVTKDEPGMLPCDFDLPAERQIIADKDRGTGD